MHFSLRKASVVAFLLVCMLAPVFVLTQPALSGGRAQGKLEAVWGRYGNSPGLFQKPRAMAIDSQDRLFIVDKSARIQVFDRNGKYSHGWMTPEWANGKPTGITFDNDGNLMIADTHYFRVLFYTPEGELIPEKTFGEEGVEPGKFGWVTDCVQDSHGNYYVSQYGEIDRIQKFSAEREFLFAWGEHGSGPRQLKRPQNLAIDEHDHIWIADACNHRLVVYDASSNPPTLVDCWGELGDQPGQLNYPYDLVVTQEYVYVCEFGNHRVQKFTRKGQVVGKWGKDGRDEGELHNPWSLVQDSRGRLHVLDTYNQRVQRLRL